MNSGLWVFDVALWLLGSGIGALVLGFWVLDSELWTTLGFYTLGFGRWVLDTGSMVLDFRF